MKKLLFLTLGLLALGACTSFEDDAGSFTMEGRVVAETAEAPFSGETVEYVYLVVSEDGSTAFDYFRSYAEKNDSINKIVEGKLYFKLGVLKEGSLESSAVISADAEDKILSSLKEGGMVELTMLEEVIPAMGASEYTVMPVSIE